MGQDSTDGSQEREMLAMGIGTSQAEGSDLLWFWHPALQHRMLPDTGKQLPAAVGSQRGKGKSRWWDAAPGRYWTEKTAETLHDKGPGQSRGLPLGSTGLVDPHLPDDSRASVTGEEQS